MEQIIKTKICEECGLSFLLNSPHQKFFCKNCKSRFGYKKYYISKKIIRKEKCLFCSKEFETDDIHRKHCSQSCAFKFKRENFKNNNIRKGKHEWKVKIDKPCLFCNKMIEWGCKGKKFCDRVCASKSRKKFLNIPDCLENASRKLDKNIGYVRVYVPMHPEANTWGYVYEHRVIAEQILGRSLKKDEIVHHKNGKRWDNRPENLEVMDRIEHAQLRGQREEDLFI